MKYLSPSLCFSSVCTTSASTILGVNIPTSDFNWGSFLNPSPDLQLLIRHICWSSYNRCKVGMSNVKFLTVYLQFAFYLVFLINMLKSELPEPETRVSSPSLIPLTPLGTIHHQVLLTHLLINWNLSESLTHSLPLLFFGAHHHLLTDSWESSCFHIWNDLFKNKT